MKEKSYLSQCPSRLPGAGPAGFEAGDALWLHVTVVEVGMNVPAKPRSSRDKVRTYRERLRRQGLRPIQIWVPDVRSPEFAAEAHRQSLAVAQGAMARDDQAFIDSVSDWSDD
jgi:hypothetical protein